METRSNEEVYQEFLDKILADKRMDENTRILVNRMKQDKEFDCTFWKLATVLSIRFPDLAMMLKASVLLGML